MDNSTTWIFTHKSRNDTRITFTPDDYRSELELIYDNPGLEPGREMMYFGGDGTLAELVRDIYDETCEVNDKLHDGVELTGEEDSVYGGYTLDALDAFEGALAYLLESVIV